MEKQTKEFQTKSEKNGLGFFTTIQEAYDLWQKDNSIWKLSFDDEEGNHRFLWKKKKDRWGYVAESQINMLSNSYRNAKEEDIFWIDQSQKEIAERYQQYFNSHPESQYKIPEDIENSLLAESITAVLSDKDFRQKYKIKKT